MCRMRLGEIRIQLERALRRGAGFRDRLFSFFRRNPAVVGGQSHRRGRQLRIGERVTRVEPDRLLVVADRFAEIVGGAAIEIEISL